MTNGIFRPRTPQVFTDPQSEDKTAQGLESDSKSICHSKQMYFYPLVISNLQMGANEARHSRVTSAMTWNIGFHSEYC